MQDSEDREESEKLKESEEWRESEGLEELEESKELEDLEELEKSEKMEEGEESEESEELEEVVKSGDLEDRREWVWSATRARAIANRRSKRQSSCFVIILPFTSSSALKSELFWYCWTAQRSDATSRR